MFRVRAAPHHDRTIIRNHHEVLQENRDLLSPRDGIQLTGYPCPLLSVQILMSLFRIQ